MVALEFRLKLSSMYSIRIPYSYQCARTYPLPPASTIKGLCANAVWHAQGGNPVRIMKEIHNASLGATSRSIFPIEVSSCMVRTIPMDARLRQFAFTPYIDCMIAFKMERANLAEVIENALKMSPVYVGDSESLVCIIPDMVNIISSPMHVNEGEHLNINSLVKFSCISNDDRIKDGIVLYMQDDPVATDAVLERCLAPLRQDGDTYYPLDSLSFLSSEEGFLFEGESILAFFPKH